MSRTNVPAIACFLVALVFLIVIPFFLKPYGIFILSMWAVMSIAAIGLNLTLGYAGQISLAQGAFVGIGAYCVAILTTHGWPFEVGLILSLFLCIGVGWVLGYPALRVQSHYLAFVTLSFTTLAYLAFRNEEWLTGGTSGISGIPRPKILGWSTNSARDYYYFCLLHLVVLSGAALWLVKSPWGLAFAALRENPTRALSLGVDTRRYTLMAFAIGSGFGGMAGALYSPLVQYIDAQPFALALSLNFLLTIVVGGSGFFLGPFIGSIVVVLLPEWLRAAEGLYLIGFGFLVVFLMLFFPSGLIGMALEVMKSIRKLRAARSPKADSSVAS